MSCQPVRVAARRAVAAALLAAAPAAGCARRPPAPARVSAGYVLFAPLLSGTTYLVDRSGSVVHTWRSGYAPGVSVRLLPGGRLLRTARRDGAPAFSGGGDGGRVQEIGWDGELLWDFVLERPGVVPHHDAAALPGGNVLLVAWERKSREEAIRAGRRGERVGPAGLYPDGLLEVRPERPRGGRVVWEWHAWDHLASRPEEVRAHPELVDVNLVREESVTDEALAKLRAIGYLAGAAGPGDRFADFMHTNSVAHHAERDEIALSVSNFGEVWILDHGTTTREAAGHAGGRAGRGGDLLYRWGNPRAYGRGSAREQRLFGQHDARWIPEGRPGAGHVLVFDNGAERPGRAFSSVVELAPPLGPDGRYALAAGRAFGPRRPCWECTAPDGRRFLAEFLSGAERLPDGDTLVCDGPRGRVFEVTPEGRTVWEYVNPFSGDAPNPHGDPPRSIFRASFVPPGDPGLAGRTLRPLVPQPPRHEPMGGAVP